MIKRAADRFELENAQRLVVWGYCELPATDAPLGMTTDEEYMLDFVYRCRRTHRDKYPHLIEAAYAHARDAAGFLNGAALAAYERDREDSPPSGK